ncbi:MAG: hypothetical protein EBU66_14490 [Bacteroidetes bacterium]|nr:hypothetical protein [bacterium]NBP65856.1 hypothetical protein [Bacteroidota bacterium]
MSSDIRVGVVGVGRNIEKTIEKEYLRIERLLQDLDFVAMYIVESDSKDKSGQVLESIRSKYPKFKYTRLGNLSEKYDQRIDRIRHCRNRYIEEIRNEKRLKNTDLIIIIDLDNINNSLKASSLTKTINEAKYDWSALFPNQLFNYYDLIALRCNRWLICDFNNLVNRAYSIYKSDLNAVRFGKSFRYELLRQKYFRRKCIRIPQSHKPLQVISAFGGMGIYKTEVLLQCDYGTHEVVPSGECEHVELHRQAAKKGFKFFVVPNLINNRISKHTLRKSLLCRLAITSSRKVGKYV